MMTIEQRYNHLLQPTEALVNDIKKISGDIAILGVGGKMGPDMARLAIAAIQQAGIDKKVYGVARFSEAGLQQELEEAGVITIKANLLDDTAWAHMPDVPNILYLAGTKFGTKGNESFTWAMNTHLPSKVAEYYKHSNIVVFSTGNVYPLSSVNGGGSSEKDSPAPVGEYAQSCLGRERIFEYFSNTNSTPTLIFRLNYANDVKYGVLHEIAKAVLNDKPVDLTMGNVNVIWQRDANEYALRSLLHCTAPPKMLNVTGPENLSVQKLATWFGEYFKKKPLFTGVEADTALLSNATECFDLFGYPATPLKKMMIIIADWLLEGRQTIHKPTHFQERHGNY